MLLDVDGRGLYDGMVVRVQRESFLEPYICRTFPFTQTCDGPMFSVLVDEIAGEISSKHSAVWVHVLDVEFIYVMPSRDVRYDTVVVKKVLSTTQVTGTPVAKPKAKAASRHEDLLRRAQDKSRRAFEANVDKAAAAASPSAHDI